MHQINAQLRDYTDKPPVEIWRDQDQLRSGDLWRPEIMNALDRASIF